MRVGKSANEDYLESQTQLALLWFRASQRDGQIYNFQNNLALNLPPLGEKLLW